MSAQAPVETASLAEDGVFGPQHDQEFEFIMVCSNIVLSILPAALMVAACPAYILSSFGKSSSSVTLKKWPLHYKLGS